MCARSWGVLFTLFAAAGATAQVTHLPYPPFNGHASEDESGWSVSGAGDVNGDGFDDVIIGARESDENGDASGSVHVLSWATGEILYAFYGDTPNEQFGASVSGAGDVNGDGFDDVIVGAWLDDNHGEDSGSARVFSGATGAILYTFNGDSPHDRFGFSVSGAGDVNGDGFDDVIVGAPLDDNNGDGSGSARVFSGATGAILYTFDGDSAIDQFGSSVSGAGDVNGDGFDDVIVGAWADDDTGDASGSARVFSGATGEVLHRWNGEYAGEYFGDGVSGAGDVNGDGFDDLIVGAPGAAVHGFGTGGARVFSGATGAILYTFTGEMALEQFGYSVSDAGDVNGDNFDDVIVGSLFAHGNGEHFGGAYVFSGATGATLYSFSGDSHEDGFGLSVSGAGDVNGDGFDDLIVGAPFDDNMGEASGSARVFFSYALPGAAQPCPGDLDGDGDADFADLNTVISNFNTSCAP